MIMKTALRMFALRALHAVYYLVLCTNHTHDHWKLFILFLWFFRSFIRIHSAAAAAAMATTTRTYIKLHWIECECTATWDLGHGWVCGRERKIKVLSLAADNYDVSIIKIENWNQSFSWSNEWTQKFFLFVRTDMARLRLPCSNCDWIFQIFCVDRMPNDVAQQETQFR